MSTDYTLQEALRHTTERDETEDYRRKLAAGLNAVAGSREDLENRHGQVWSTDELQRDFDVTGFGTPFVVVRRKSDGQVGSLEFQSSPRFYFNFMEDN